MIGCKGVIYGIPLTVDMKELIENLRMRCKVIKSVKRMNKKIGIG